MMKKKKIIIVSTVGLMYDGITSVIMSYLQAMNLEKFDIYVVSTIKSDNTIKKTILDLGCHVIELPSRKTETLKYLLCLIKCIRTNQIEVLHAHGNSATLAIEMLAGWAGGCKKRIAHSHNTQCEQVQADKWLRPLFYLLYTDAFACGEDAGKWLFGTRSFIVLNNGRNLEKFAFDPHLREKMRLRYKIDDGSTDDTFGIISKWKSEIPIVLYKEKNAGPAMSFWNLLKKTEISADYYAFCDQDDIWDNDKLEVGIKHLHDDTHFYACNCRIIDTVMLGFICTNTDVGYYNAAVKIKTILVSIVTSLGVVLLPRASYYVEHDMLNEFYRITRKAINFVFLVAAPLMIYFILFSQEGIYFLSGSAYTGSIIPMQIIMPTLLLIGLTNIMGIQMLIPLGKEKVVLYSEIVGVIVDVILNALLIPQLASSGAAIGTLVAETAVWIIQFCALKKDVCEAYRKVKYSPIVIGLVIATVLSHLVEYLSLGSFFTLCVSAILFFGAYAVVLTVMKEPLVLEIERQMFDKFRRKRE